MSFDAAPPGESLWRAARRLLQVVAAIGLACSWSGAAAGSLPKHEIEAAYILNFVKYTQWPQASFEGTSPPFVIGVAGRSLVTESLKAGMKNRRIDGREVEVVTLESPAALPRLHVLYISQSEEPRVDAWLEAATRDSILTVAESRDFIRRGGIVELVQEYDRLRFELNMHVAERSGLTISAQVQMLAKSVIRSP